MPLGYNGRLRDELLKVEIFDTMLGARVLIERWRQIYNKIRPYGSLGYRPPAPEAWLVNSLSRDPSSVDPEIASGLT
jgi:transposase InsO family protein